MSQAPERIWVWWDDEYDVGGVNKHGDPRYTPTEAREYVPKDLVRAQIEAAVKRALEGLQIIDANPATPTDKETV